MPQGQYFQDDFTLPEAALAMIQEKLASLEKHNNVKILYACESGSRGWGFASKDSDFDVHFIYIHPPLWYLSLAPEEKRDVIEMDIEQTPVGEMDINGWELRKALKLFRAFNPPLLEWLSSPLVYQEIGPLAELLRNAAQKNASPLKIWHHYHSLMVKHYDRYRGKKPSIKMWFYMLRALLSMRWIEMNKKPVPMRFDHLMNAVIEDDILKQELEALILRKKQGKEQETFVPPANVAAFIQAELQRIDKTPPQLSVEQEKIDLDSIFRMVLMQAWPKELWLN